MKTKYNLSSVFGRLLLLACLLAVSREAMSDNYTYNADNYTAYQAGNDAVRFTLPTGNISGTNDGVEQGRVSIIVDGGSRQTVFDWNCVDYSNVDTKGCYIQASQGGKFELQGTVKGGYKTFYNTNGQVFYELNADGSNSDHYTTTVVWTVPRELRGKNLKIYVWAQVNWGAAGNWHVPSANSSKLLLDWDCPETMETSVSMFEPMLSFDRSNVNSLMFAYSVSAKKIKSMAIHYTDAITGKAYSRNLPTSSISGSAYIPADRPWKDVYIDASVIDYEGKDAGTISSEKMSTKMLHHPRNLAAEMTTEGKVKLSWQVDEPNEEDIEDYDFFEIQRNVTGTTDANDKNWRTIAQETTYQKGKKDYAFTDTTLLDEYCGKQVAYRVRRSTTATWQWAEGSGHQMYQIYSLFMLPTLQNPTVQRSETWNDDSHIVKIAFDLATIENDSQGRFIVRNDEDIKKLKDKGISYSQAIFLVSSRQDWERIAKLVSEGGEMINILQMSNIDLVESQVMIGAADRPFSGTYDGNGYTLTVNYSNAEDYTAPFRYVNGATIRNLRVNGNVTSNNKKFSSGLIGRTNGGENLVENCQSSVVISSTIVGDATNAGFVAYVPKGNIHLKNCRFDGSLLGSECSHNAGLIGFVDDGGKATIDNCLFAPAEISTKADECKTFARCKEASLVTLNNCFYTRQYGMLEVDAKKCFVIYTADDWKLLKSMVDNAFGNEVHAVLANDISIGRVQIGTKESAPYRGCFFGNGHTIHVDCNWEDWDYTAPICYIRGASIYDVRVTGTVIGKDYTAGLVGRAIGGTNLIFNSRVSANITNYGTRAAGIIGYVNVDATISVSDCRFDGTITNMGPGSYVSPFIGMVVWNNNVNIFRNNLETGIYNNFSDPGLAFYTQVLGGGVSNIKNGMTTNIDNNYSNKTYIGFGYMSSSFGQDYMGAGSLAPASLVQKLGDDDWEVVDNTVVPKVYKKQNVVEAQGGTYATKASDMAEKLGEGWELTDDEIFPKMTVTTDNAYNIVTWDPKARIQLRVNMHGENGIDSRIYELTDNLDAIRKHGFTQELTRRCVEYSFDLLTLRGKSAMHFVGSDLDTLKTAVTKVDKTEADKVYKYENMAKISDLTTKTKQSSVELEWKTNGGESDFFRILRREHTDDANAAWTDTIATNLQPTSYEDKTVLAQRTYDYRVESIFQCEGVKINGAEKQGNCEPTGMIDGYVYLADGTAMAKIRVKCEPVGKIAGATVRTTYTDSVGYYVFRGLPFQGTGSYQITVEREGATDPFTMPNAEGLVKFTTSSNWTHNYNIYQDTYYVYSGNVYYRDTSIPVPGVGFLLDGQQICDASRQPIVTDTQGHFELSIPSGPHKVQAVKKGHYFANEGYLLNADAREGDDPRKVNFVKNISGVFLWDSTTVVLHGRVVGGEDQGTLPLGKSLSKNNLGDSLKIVMQLEGDNASYLIRKQDDETVKTADYVVAFGLENAKGECSDTTMVHVTRHTLTIKPDPKTGEYQVALHPAKYKVIEVSAQGYATLFQGGQVGETVDLTFNGKGDTVVYNRIYHAIPDVEVTQYNPGGERYFGVKKVTATDNIGGKSDVNLVYYTKETPNAQDSIMHYSFDYPVFMGSSPYGWILQACEKYYWNNDKRKKVDIVKLHSGKVSIKNYLIGNDDSQLTSNLELDEDGGASYIFTPTNTTFVLEGDNALKTVDITLEYDGSYYDIKPLDGQILKGFVMATKPKAEGRKAIAASKPILFDILRDPPGGSSYSYLEAGSKLSYSYNANVEAEAGFDLSRTVTSGAEFYEGIVAAPEGNGKVAGEIHHQKKDNTYDVTLTAAFAYSWQYNYNMELTERIQTKSGQKWIGGKADLFMGLMETVIVQDALAVRAIPDSMYQIVKGHEGGTFEVKDKTGEVVTKVKVPVGTTKVLAKGTDGTGKPVYLVRDEVMQASPAIGATFVHSQHYIENELLPDLYKVRNSMILPKGTDVTRAKALANEQGRPTYISQVEVDDENYGVAYDMIVPDKGSTTDTISIINQNVLAWVGFLASNEEEKISVMKSNLVKRYDFDGAANIQYSESFAASSANTRSVHYPGVSDFSSAAMIPVVANILKAVETYLSSKGQGLQPVIAHPHNKNAGGYDYSDIVVAVPGSKVSYKHQLILDGSFNDKFGVSDTQSKKIGFNLAASSKSSLTVDVYRTETEYTVDTTSYNGQNTFNKVSMETLDYVREGKLWPQPGVSFVPNGPVKVYSSFVFRTVGGVTCQPYEKERVTKWYQPGTVIDVATIPADKPHIWIEEPVVSNVPFDEPARFVLHMANETDYPERATMQFNYFLEAGSNPNGVRVCVDGAPLTGAGVDIVLWPALGSDGKHNVFTKEITVYPSKAFDYEDLSICLMDPEDNARVFTQKFSAHFIPAAGKVKVSVPSNNWVMNTESPYDGKRQAYYMPVRIEGFDVNWPSFDHIELQYKLSTQGDKDWVNVCSYYADKELQSKASGVTDTIPNSGVIVAPFYGEIDPVEQYYDIRAVTYCRYGGGYLTGSSEVLKGIKDTRLPVAFGTPEPTNGILGIGDDILIKFSEPIAGNYLRSINNFEVLGTLLSNDISTSTSLSFDGNALAATQGERNLTGKSFTVDIMLNPAVDKREMTVFSHGGDEKGMRFGVTADKKLSATINGETLVSDTIVPFNNMLHQVAYVLDQSGDKTTVKFYDGSKAIGSKQLKERYEGASSDIVLGADFDYTKDLLYKGEMLEFRLWNRAMSSGELDSYGKKKLTGYETGLLDYYPMNEGEGTWAYDKAPGSMDLFLSGTSWKRPAGIAMEIKGDKGLRLKPDKFARGKNHDYTLTFWFRTNDGNATLLSNGEAKYGQADQLNIGIKDSILYVRSQGFEKATSALVSEGSWHHFAMTVSRSQNVSNVYVDKTLVETFPADSVGGILGNDITLGATFVDRGHQTNVMKGHIDEVGMFESVLPLNLIKEYSNHTPLGTMSAMMAYMDFGRSEKQDDNQQHLEPTGISLKRYLDSQGKVVARRDTLVADEEVDALAARDFYAPMVSNAQLDNLNYRFVANGNELYMNIKEPDYMVEKTNIYVTVKEVLDLQGNTMASPITMNLYVYRNPLRWDVKRIERDVDYGNGATFEATVRNQSGVKQNFKLTDLPLWITASQTQGVLDALDEQTITFTVSDYINIGTYNEQIALVGDNTMSEPLPITLRVRGDEPEWAVSDRLKQANQTMMMVARVKIDGVVASSEEDMLAVFDEKQQTLGVAHIEVNDNANANEALAYLNIYGYMNPDGSKPQLHFCFFDASSGNVYSVKPADDKIYRFEQDAIVGSDADPVVLQNSYNDVQTLKLKKGWNWVTFNVIPKEGATLGQFLNSMSKWEIGDVISTVNGTETKKYTCRQNKKAASGQQWDNEDDPITINPAQMYMIYSMSDKTVYVEGEFARRYITVHKDWNRVGYNTTINLPIAQALADYLEQAQVGDVVKSQDGFAIASQTATGLTWKGSLQYLEAGKGYMIKRQSNDEVKFLYPIYFNDSRYSSTSENRAPRRSAVNTATTMNLVAAVEGIEVEAGDKLVVFCGAERLAETTADDELNYYLNIGSDANSLEPLTFVLEREGETIAMAGSHISYAPNEVLGTPEHPTVINFLTLDQLPNDGKWYTVGGIQLGKKPTRSGVYIYNNNKIKK